jgi:diacylglycerol kinase
MPRDFPSVKRPWFVKFRDAFRGVVEGVRGQNSFAVHFIIAAAAIVAGFVLKISLTEWCFLAICIAGVLTAEMFNSSLEFMAKAITSKSDPHLRNSLDIGSAAVLTASVGAGVVGAIIFINRLGITLAWWR